jgi:hypothetical protein
MQLNKDVPILIDLKKPEISGDLGLEYTTSDGLAQNESKGYDGYYYGLLRGYWRALCWVLNDQVWEHDILDELN